MENSVEEREMVDGEEESVGRTEMMGGGEYCEMEEREMGGWGQQIKFPCS